jgi:photosystem II stability/assembly factor-like uncharacterized protein
MKNSVLLLFKVFFAFLLFPGILLGSANENPTQDNFSFSPFVAGNNPDSPMKAMSDSYDLIASKASKTDPEHTWQHPLLNGNRLTDIVHLGNNTIFVVGNHGTAMRSTNNGIDWEMVESPFGQNVLSADASGQNKIVVAGQNGIVAITDDLGNTWNVVQTPANQDLRTIRFLSESTILAVGNNKTAVISTNQGIDWQVLNIPDEVIFNPNNRPNWTYRGIAVTSGAVHVGVDGTGMPVQVIRSTDSGATWTQVTASGINVPGASLGVGVTDLSFSADGNTGYGSYRSGLAGGIIRTLDGGNTWARVVIDGFAPLPDPDNPYVSQTVQMRNSMAVSSDGTHIITGGLFGQVLASTDSGQSWFEIYGGVRQGFRDFHAVDFPGTVITNDNEWIVVGSRGLITSSDTFAAGSGVVRNGDEPIHTFRDVLFTDEQTGYSVGFRTGQKFTSESGDMIELAMGLFYSTTDGGQTWQPFEGPENVGYRWHAIKKDEDGGFYIAGLDYSDGTNIHGIIRYSNDAGATWETVATATQEIGALRIWDSQHGYAITFGNQFLFINEQGNWSTSVMPPPVSQTNSLYSLDVLGPKIVFAGGGTPAAGGDPFIFKSIDGGINWQRVFSHTNTGRISRIQFMDGAFGMAGGVWGPTLNRQNILVTQDYGNTWTPVDINFVGVGSSEILYFNIANEGHIIAYGANGHVVKSIDNDDLEFFGDEHRFSSVSFAGGLHPSGNTGWVVGNDGAIVKYEAETPTNTVPALFANIYPGQGDEIDLNEDDVTFTWSPSYDPDGGTITYFLTLESVEDNQLVFEYETSETFFVLSPETAGDLQNGAYHWRVVAVDSDDYSATTHPFDIEVIVDGDLSGENEIVSFVLSQETRPAVIDSELFTVDAEVEYGTSLISLAPVIEVSQGAAIDPPSGQELDFTEPVIYVVTAANGDTQEWTVTVSVEVLPSDDATLADLMVDGETIAGFDPDVTEYHITLAPGTVNPPLVEATPNDSGAGVTIVDAVDLGSEDEEDRTTFVHVTAEDQQTQMTYKVIFDVGTSTDNLTLNKISTYPNPAKDYLNVSIDATTAVSARLINLTGEIVWEKTSLPDYFQIPVSDIGEGLFILVIQTSNGNISTKIQVIK